MCIGAGWPVVVQLSWWVAPGVRGCGAWAVGSTSEAVVLDRACVTPSDWSVLKLQPGKDLEQVLSPGFEEVTQESAGHTGVELQTFVDCVGEHGTDRGPDFAAVVPLPGDVEPAAGQLQVEVWVQLGMGTCLCREQASSRVTDVECEVVDVGWWIRRE